ncbi:hypothetical protein RN001_008654 [Aquatica leii]|uniref:Uncharacterized protein n=1 Tax=Aquatica leii TaxID=1421715 RepID=A0AAN7PB01_9COLE|nr:hypothetical protein RN001_008654 [Aquatica leii]
MMIGNIDKKRTKQLQEREKRKLKQEKSLQEANSSKVQKFDKPDKERTNRSVELGDSLSDDHTVDLDLPLLEDNNTPSTSSGISNKSRASLTITYAQMRKTLPTVARECDRWGLSDRSAAAVCSALLQDLVIVTENDTASVIDRSKIRRERQ